MIKMLQYKMYPAGELAVLRQLLFICMSELYYLFTLCSCNLFALIVLLFQHLLSVCLSVLFYQQLTFQLALVFSTLPFVMRVRRFNARKDCLVCIIRVIASSHYLNARDLNANLHNHYFINNNFVSKIHL